MDMSFLTEILGAIRNSTPAPFITGKVEDRIPQGDPYAMAFLGSGEVPTGGAQEALRMPQIAPNPAQRAPAFAADDTSPAAMPSLPGVGGGGGQPRMLDPTGGGEPKPYVGPLGGIFDGIIGERRQNGGSTFKDRLAAGLKANKGPYGFGSSMGAAMGEDRKISGEELEKKLKTLQGARGVRGDDHREHAFGVNTDLKVRQMDDTRDYRNRSLDVRQEYLRRPTNAQRAAWEKPDAQRAAEAERLLTGVQKRIWNMHGLGAGTTLYGARREEALKNANAAFEKAKGVIYRQQGLNPDGTPLNPSGPRNGPTTMQQSPQGLVPRLDPNSPLGKVTNPHKPRDQAEFDAILPGEVYVNPRDGKSYVKIDRSQMQQPIVPLEKPEDEGEE